MARQTQLDGGRLVWPTGQPITITWDAALAPAARWWADTVRHAFDIDPMLVTQPQPTVQFIINTGLPPSGYAISITDTIAVHAADLAGAFAAAQTLRQLAGPNAFRAAPLPGAQLSLPTGTITDAPGCAWRGVHLDVSRHFMPPREVRRFVELAAAHHLNVVQLHLTDDQGWRFESSHYPKLTSVGGWRVATARGQADSDPTPHGGFYTQDDLREIVAFGRARGVTVMPEIDLPGHVEAAIAAYPWLGTSKQPQGVRTTWGISEDVLDPGPNQVGFFCDVLDEVCDVFDSPFIHIGGDEVPTTLWQGNPQIVARAAELGFCNPDGTGDVTRLHGWFLAQMTDHLRQRGRRAVVWDEAIGPDLPHDAIVMSWRGLRPAVQALSKGWDVVLAPEQFVYFDHRASDRPDEPSPIGFVRRVEDVYAFDVNLLADVPIEVTTSQNATAAKPMPQVAQGGLAQVPPPEEGRPGVVLGMQAEIWTEYLENPRRVDYAAFPRLAAFSEAAWGTAPADRAPGSPASQRFMQRLANAHLPRLAAAGVEFRPLDGPLPWQQKPDLPGRETDDLDEVMRAAGGLL